MEAIYHDDGVNVIGHDHEGVDPNLWMVVGDQWHPALSDSTGGREHDCAIDH